MFYTGSGVGRGGVCLCGAMLYFRGFVLLSSLSRKLTSSSRKRLEVAMVGDVQRGRPLLQGVPSSKTVRRTVLEFTPCGAHVV